MFIFISFVLTMLLTTNVCVEAWEISPGTRLPANLPSFSLLCSTCSVFERWLWSDLQQWWWSKYALWFPVCVLGAGCMCVCHLLVWAKGGRKLKNTCLYRLSVSQTVWDNIRWTQWCLAEAAQASPFCFRARLSRCGQDGALQNKSISQRARVFRFSPPLDPVLTQNTL